MRRLGLALALLLPGAVLAGCGEDGSGPSGTGSVEGTVQIEGAGVPDVTVDLSGTETYSVTTDPDGAYAFVDVAAGTYVVTLADTPEDAAFPSTAKPAVVARGRTERVDFTGSFIRTASINGSVTVGEEGIAGVTVVLSGVESDTTETDENGRFSFTGLRGGEYRVEIPEPPQGISFGSLAADVRLATGASELATFHGERELTASVFVRTIRSLQEDGSTVPADPRALEGWIEVAVVVDRGEDTLERVELLLGEEVVAAQSFDTGSSPSATGASEDPPRTASPVELAFSVNTAAFDRATGEPRFANGEHLLEARLATVEGGPSAWVSTVPVTLRNADTVHGTVTAERGPFAGPDGHDWIGGTITVRVLPVLYDRERQLEEVTVELRRVGGGSILERVAAEGPPFEAVFPAEGEGEETLAGYRTPEGSADRFRVRAARYVEGGSLEALPVPIGEEVRIDNGS